MNMPRKYAKTKEETKRNAKKVDKKEKRFAGKHGKGSPTGYWLYCPDLFCYYGYQHITPVPE